MGTRALRWNRADGNVVRSEFNWYMTKPQNNGSFVALRKFAGLISSKSCGSQKLHCCKGLMNIMNNLFCVYVAVAEAHPLTQSHIYMFMSSFLAEKQYKSTENLRMFQRTVALLCFSHSRNRNENNGMCGGFMDTTIHNYVAMFLFFVVIVLSTHLSFEPQSSSMYVFFIWPYEERCE